MARLEPGISVKLARPRDADLMAEMSRDYIEQGLPLWQWTGQRIRDALKDRETCAILALRDSSIVGFAMMKFGDLRAYLMLLAVHSAARRQGVGSALYAWLEESVLVAGINEIALEVRADNTGAHRFYESLGFKQERILPRYYCGRLAAHRMTRIVGTPDSE
ncbi:MAG: GNAT family N-acetyltransferase [Gammaproteobacteria bacterium]|nr:GNAT family N-acetyltransferase [Gammaproteobacteria bacterium]